MDFLLKLEFWTQAVGFVALAFFLLGYLQRKRKNILIFNLTSRVLYILQYLLNGTPSGAVLDVAGSVSTVLAQKKDTSVIKRNIKAVIIVMNLFIIGAGVYSMIYFDDTFGFLPILGVMFHTNAFWIDDEKTIRRLSLIGSPFWLAYNAISGLPFACIGDLLSIVSLGIAMYRYDRKGSKEKCADE